MRFPFFALISVLACTACSATPDKEARQQSVTILPGTYAVSSIDPAQSNDPTCAENYGNIVGHLEYLMAQKNSGIAAVQSQ